MIVILVLPQDIGGRRASNEGRPAVVVQHRGQLCCGSWSPAKRRSSEMTIEDRGMAVRPDAVEEVLRDGMRSSAFWRRRWCRRDALQRRPVSLRGPFARGNNGADGGRDRGS